MMRYHIQNETHMAEFEKSPEGLKQAKLFRATNAAFKRRRIREVWQTEPSRIPCGEVIEMT
jgi:hypothetical protein